LGVKGDGLRSNQATVPRHPVALGVTLIDASDFIGEEQQMDTTGSLEGLTALVTSATSGMGRAAAQEFGRLGAEVVVHGRATKATLPSLTRTWAAEFSPAGVRVNADATGPVYTPIQSADEAEAISASTVVHRAAEPQEIANVIAMLASPNPTYITGTIVTADRGRAAV
jgi:NAD(P)-dependent dehydrogenase (short-subunit alcohol dehydrogenase family)